MRIREYLSDWVVVMMSGTILISAIYMGYLDVLDGRYIHPILEMGTRSQINTHQTIKNSYKPGEMVYARVTFHKNRNILGNLQWHLINQRMVTYSVRDGSLPLGVWDKIVPVERIPDDARAGPHYFAGTVTYKPNWLGRVEYAIWTNKFEVVRK